MNHRPSNVLFGPPIHSKVIERIAGEFSNVDWIDCTGHEDPSSAEVFFGRFEPRWTKKLESVRWIQLPSAGVAPAVRDFGLDRKILVTNASGIYGQSVAEHTLGLMLALARRLDVCIHHQTRKEWLTPTLPLISDLCGTSVGILGTGDIGRGIARLCKALGMQVLGLRRTPRPTPYVDRIYGPDEMISMVRKSQWLVSALPLTAETKGLIGSEVFGAMPVGSRFINVSRGKVVKQDALISALQSGHLGGAALDVTDTEPLPKDDPLWETPRTIITPHVSADPANSSYAVCELFARNLHRYQAGSPLENLVDLERGY